MAWILWSSGFWFSGGGFGSSRSYGWQNLDIKIKKRGSNLPSQKQIKIKMCESQLFNLNPSLIHIILSTKYIISLNEYVIINSTSTHTVRQYLLRNWNMNLISELTYFLVDKGMDFINEESGDIGSCRPKSVWYWYQYLLSVFKSVQHSTPSFSSIHTLSNLNPNSLQLTYFSFYQSNQISCFYFLS